MDMLESSSRATPRSLVIAGHDYRSRRRVNMHFIADELAKRGPTRFFSIGFSPLSFLQGDPRASLARRSNRVERSGNVECYLWRTLWHPVDLNRPALRGVSSALFERYARRAPELLERWMAESDHIIFESGMSPIFFELAEKVSPASRRDYLASDLLETIGVDPCVGRALERGRERLDAVILPSRRMARHLGAERAYYVPHGFHAPSAERAVTSPFPPGVHAVSVGSMLFDRSFFELAASEFPDVTFHVIGGGRNARGLRGPNLEVYGEMPFAETLSFVRFASFGIAPYQREGVSEYLCDTSMKLAQYAFFGVPAVCPSVAVGEHAGRFGYTPGDRASIAAAIRAALAAERPSPPRFLSWSDVVDRILAPAEYPDTAIVA